jgi:hypothetical protein
MRTRTVLRWHHDPRDLAELALFIGACAALTLLDYACERLENWIDNRAEELP